MPMERPAGSVPSTPPPAHELDEGFQLGNYVVVRKIGAGGIGAVYLGRHAVVHQQVALKVHAHVPDDPEIQRAFCTAANYLSQLEHRSIVRLYDYGIDHGLAYQALEYVPGATLDEIIPADLGEAWVERTLDMFEQLLAALRYAHSCRYRDLDGAARTGIVHGDVKPQNVLVAPDGAIRLTDFMVPDVQRYLAEGKAFRLSDTAAYGTPGYMAPEQERGHVDQRSDVYSAGQSLFQLLTRRLGIRDGDQVYSFGEGEPVAVGSPAALNPYVPEWLDELVLRAIELDPSARFQTVAEMERVIFANRRQRGEIIKEVVMGDHIEITAHDISASGGQLFMGKFHDVAATLEAQGKGELAQTLKLLKEAIMASEHIPEQEKAEQVQIATQLGEEAAKDKPNKTMLKALRDGLLTALRAVPDVAAAVAAAAPVLAHL
jgi:serine/threonine protein kinase